MPDHISALVTHVLVVQEGTAYRFELRGGAGYLRTIPMALLCLGDMMVFLRERVAIKLIWDEDVSA